MSDTVVGQAIAAGATTREEVTRACGAGGDCGACHGHIEDMIDQAAERTGPQLVGAGALVRHRAA